MHDERKIKVQVVRTHYPHWGQHSGISQFIRHLDGEAFSIREMVIPMDSPQKNLAPIKRYLLKRLSRMGMNAYGFNDLDGEIRVLLNCIWRSTDIIHFVDAEHSLMFLPGWLDKLRAFRRVPRIIAMFHQPPSILRSIINLEIVRKVDRILVVAPEQKTFFEECLGGARVELILHGIDTDYFRPDPKEREGCKFRCVAGGVWLRDYDTFLKTAACLQEYQDIEFHILAPRGDIQSGLGNVIFHEEISDGDLLRLYQSAEVLFMPLNASTANNVILEAIACGLPVVSSRLEGVRAYVPEEASILVPNNDPKAFAEALLKLYRERNLREEMGRKARIRAVELSWDKISPRYEGFYRRVCEG